MSNETKEQHFVPQMYLKRFTSDGEKCYTLNRKNGIHHQNKDEICKKKNLYEMKINEDEIFLSNLIEKEFFGKTEDEFTPFFDELLSKIDNNQSILDFIHEEDNRECLMWFISSMILRNKFTMSQTKNVLLENYGLDWTDIQVRNFCIIQNVAYIKQMCDKMCEENNLIIHINRTRIPYITACFPFVLRRLGMNRCILWYFPVSPQCLVIIEPIRLTSTKRDIEIQSNSSFVNEINTMFAAQDETLLISNRMETLEELKNWRLKNE